MADPVDPVTAAAARARLAADAHRGVESEPGPAERLTGPAGPHRPGAPRPSAADVLSGREDAHTVASEGEHRPRERSRGLADLGD